MTTRKLSEKQKQKLKDNGFARSNSSDLTINKSFQDAGIKYEDGNLSYDKRTKEGKEIERILNSRNRSSNKKTKEMNAENDFENKSEIENIKIQLKQILTELGHSATFIKKALSLDEADLYSDSIFEVEEEVYEMLSSKEQLKEVNRILAKKGLSDTNKKFLMDEFLDRPVKFIKKAEKFEECYQKGLKHYNNENEALLYAKAWWYINSPNDKLPAIPEINDEFEKIVKANAPWRYFGDNIELFEHENVYYAEDIISWYYENSIGNSFEWDESELKLWLLDRMFMPEDYCNRPDE